MAQINSRLQIIASDLFIKYNSDERDYIEDKISNLKANLKDWFGSSISEILVFGSYKRDTILPRKFDEHSDVDILVVFSGAEQERTPETYRTRLKKFAEGKYPTSKVLKDHPSIVLEMNKIKFDLVPSRKSGYYSTTYEIPDKSGYWMSTDPIGFNASVTEANTRYLSIVKPIIRLFKRWNANNDYPFTTYDLEKDIAAMNFHGDNYQTGFLYVISQLSSYGLSIAGGQKVETLKANGNWVIEYLNRDNQEKAIEVTCRILGIKP
ncbi:SMODS domain-containing nucleotidyltransferase [Dyadobacter sp. CY347]|uniref:SMODS domain-containing nucleotidyltransferase n=1 Tax=Dyadobacter sp. CY347 TaxID=2909336 RepID=UPI001F41767D|nr:nucleotidyltransferase domain-containing protein [Dyadobacter sp. CY347]MCF2490762.1 nucleotidyltransferase domain-containing protein [Dyadobacter sp. CY347]